MRLALKSLLGEKQVAAINDLRNYVRTMRSRDRVVLRRSIVPAFAAARGKILWIGCRRYTAAYPEMLERQGATCWTVDIDPEAAIWGRRGRHLVADACALPYSPDEVVFDSVLCNGVFGFGVDAPVAQKACLASIARILRPGGVLLLGWNTDRTEDPIEAGRIEPWFEPTAFGSLEQRLRCAGTTHVYDLLRRRSA
jgi:SAM-dependent methyltransferase